MPTDGQIALLVVAIVLFVVGSGLSVGRLWFPSEELRIGSKALLYSGIVAGVAALIWHSSARHRWLPLEDNFDALTWLALLLALFLVYTQRTRPLRGLDWFIMPIVILLLIAAAVFGRTEPREYVRGGWLWVHWVTAYGGAVAFAVAGAVGAMYLIANRRLRNKRVAPGTSLGSLERLEHLTLMSVTLGFALLTIGLVTGLVRALDPRSRNTLGPDWYVQPKVVLAFIAWLVYAVVLHSPINPSFRGRKAALLSVVGFVLMIAAIVAVQLMPR